MQLAYVNPETGGECLNTLAFAALLLRPGEEIALPRVSAARVFHAVEGSGDAQVNDAAIAFEHADTFCAPGLASGAPCEPLEPRAALSRHAPTNRRCSASSACTSSVDAGTAMSVRPDRSAPVLVVGGGIGGMAVALALSQSGFAVEVFEQSAEIGEIGAGLQLGPNGFAAMDALGVGERARKRAVYTDELIMMDAIDGSEVARMPVGEAFRRRFNNPYAVIHRADIHQSVYEEVQLAAGHRRPHFRAHRARSTSKSSACGWSTPTAASTKAQRSSAATACIRSYASG